MASLAHWLAGSSDQVAIVAVVLVAAALLLAVGTWSRKRARRLPRTPVIDASDLDNGQIIDYLQEEKP